MDPKILAIKEEKSIGKIVVEPPVTGLTTEAKSAAPLPDYFTIINALQKDVSDVNVIQFLTPFCYLHHENIPFEILCAGLKLEEKQAREIYELFKSHKLFIEGEMSDVFSMAQELQDVLRNKDARDSVSSLYDYPLINLKLLAEALYSLYPFDDQQAAASAKIRSLQPHLETLAKHLEAHYYVQKGELSPLVYSQLQVYSVLIYIHADLKIPQRVIKWTDKLVQLNFEKTPRKYYIRRANCLFKAVAAHRELSQLDQAIDKLNLILKIYQLAEDTIAAQVVQCGRVLANVQRELGAFEAAANCDLEVTNAVFNDPGTTQLQKANSLTDSAYGYICRAQYELAYNENIKKCLEETKKGIDLQNQALNLYLQVWKSPHPDFANVYCNLGLAYYIAGELENAIKYFARATADLDQYSKKPASPFVVAIRIELTIGRGCVHRAKQENESAVKWHQEALQLIETEDKSKKYLASAHLELARDYAQLQKADAAILHYKEAKRYFAEITPRHPFITIAETELKPIELLQKIEEGQGVPKPEPENAESLSVSSSTSDSTRSSINSMPQSPATTPGTLFHHSEAQGPESIPPRSLPEAVTIGLLVI